MASHKELFLSYGREAEVVEFVKKLKGDLEADGFGVWLDQNDIPAGCDWHAAIGSGLEHSKALLAVVTPKYVSSRYCTSELYTADGDQKLIFPIFYADTDLSLSERSRGVKYVISGINWTMFRPNVDDYDMSLEKLKFGMRQHGLGNPSHQPEATRVADNVGGGGGGGTPAAVVPGSTDGGLVAAVEKLSLSSAPPAAACMPEGVPRSVSPFPGGGHPPPAAEGADDVDGTGLPSYESSLRLPDRQGQPPHAYAYGSSSPGQPQPPQGYPGPAPGQGQSPYAYAGQTPGQGQPQQGYRNAPAWCPPTTPSRPATDGHTQYQTPPYGQMTQPYPPLVGGVPPAIGGAPPAIGGVPQYTQGGAPPYGSSYSTPTHPAHRGMLYSDNTATPAYRSPAQAAGFAAGLRLEAVDRTNPYIIGVAHIREVNSQGQLFINFDSWGTGNTPPGYWCEPSSLDIRPVGWAASSRQQLHPPDGFNPAVSGPFNWFHYLAASQLQAAPHYLFTEAQRTPSFTQPPTPNRSAITSPGRGDIASMPTTPATSSTGTGSISAKTFAVKMALEVDDPDAPELTYICSIIDVKTEERKIKLHYEGWQSSWDFWVDSNKGILHPPGWCTTHGRLLQKPTGQTFVDWPSYVMNHGYTMAPDYLFNEDQQKAPAVRGTGMPGPWGGAGHQRPPFNNVGACVLGFMAGMAVEVDDPMSPSLTYLCSIVDVDVDGKRIKVHYEGWSQAWDFWIGATSTTFHYMGWCQSVGKSLHLHGEACADWQTYLAENDLCPATKEIFDERSSVSVSQDRFVCGHALEINDPATPRSIHLAAIVDTKPTGDKIKVTYVGWSNDYDFWIDIKTSQEMHPIGFCKATGQTLHMPGNAKADDVMDYLKANGLVAASPDLFVAAQKKGMSSVDAGSSSGSSGAIGRIQVGMRLEAVDIRHPTLICCATVTSVQPSAGRVEVHFDGWGPEYDYWCQWSDEGLHPVGWCAANGRALQPPHGAGPSFGGWETYLASNGYSAVPRNVFSAAQCSGMPAVATFEVGMRLEAVDRKNPSMVCAASVVGVDTGAGRVEIHFDGWNDHYNYWCSIDDDDIHPVGWCSHVGRNMIPPNGLVFESWKSYLQRNCCYAAPIEVFASNQCGGMKSLPASVPCKSSSGPAATPAKPEAARPPFLFEVGMRLEAKDRLNPSMVCVASVVDLNASQQRVEVYFDGWSARYNYWCDATDSDVHPVGWCRANSRTLQPPKDTAFSSWESYLSQNAYRAVPFKAFTSGQTAGMPPQADNFQKGMKLEARDRLNPHMVCVATIADIQNGRLLIHFDGWTVKYDYWCAPDTEDIRPVGWCDNVGCPLQPPKGQPKDSFHWNGYLAQEGATSAPKHLFAPEGRTQIGCFMKNMKLEAKDRQNPTLTCAASIVKVQEGRLLVHFDGWTDTYDYWCERSSADVHPIGWCKQNGLSIKPPKGHVGAFQWADYLEQQNARAVPRHLFTEEQLAMPVRRPFEVGMKLEAKDRKNPTMTCVATVEQMRAGGEELLIHFDGWTAKYDYWCCRDTADIHPLGWCNMHRVKLQPPKGMNSATFNWNQYLMDIDGMPAPDACFTPASRSAQRS